MSLKNTPYLFKNYYNKAINHKIISVLVIISITSLGYYYYSKQTTAAISYQYTLVKRGSLTSIVSGTGQVISNSQVDLKPKVNANVTGVYVRAGDRVHVGQILFRLDATDAYKQVRDAKTALESAKIALEKLRNPKTIDIMTLKSSIQQELDAKTAQDLKVATAHRALLTSGIQAYSENSYTIETPPTITGSYTKNTEGQIKISVYQGGTTGYGFSLSGVTSGSGQVNTIVAQPLGDTGLYIKWNNTNPQTNWIIDIPNKQSTNYSSNYDAWQNAITARDTANAASDRNIASYTQKLADLTPGDDNLDVRSAKLQVEQRQNALTDAQQTLNNYTLTAPFDGVMASVSVDIGASAVMASANSSAALGTIVTDKKLAQVTINETDIVKVHLGQKASMTFDAIDGLVVDGDIVEVNTLGTITSGVVTYKVKLAFNIDDPRILPNMSVSADIITDSKDNILYVPSQAIKHDVNGYYVEKDSSLIGGGTASTSKNFNNASSSLYRTFATTTASSAHYRGVNGSSTRKRVAGSNITSTSEAAGVTLIRVPITIGTQNDTQTEIITGLQEGEKIILKKTTTPSSTTVAPSITSLFKPQGGGNRTPATPSK